MYQPGPDLAGGRPGPSGVFGISERDWLSNYRVLKIEGFGGRPPVGGRPEAPLNLALVSTDARAGFAKQPKTHTNCNTYE